MRRRTILALIALISVSAIMASPVDLQRAIQVAQQFVPQSTSALRTQGRGSATSPIGNIVYTHKMPQSDRPAFYIINVDEAFVIVSADDIAHQILGYSLSKKWPVSKDGTIELPTHIKSFFDDLAAQIEAATSAAPNQEPDADWTDSRSRAPMRSQSNLPDSVGPLLTTTWDQGQYYNALCPEDVDGPDAHAQNGCVATAMAQIIKYWGDSIQIRLRGTHSYNSKYGTLTVDYNNDSYDYANMPNQLTAESTPEQVIAVAKLMYHCGIAANMNYGATESSAFDMDARAGLINYYSFSPDLSYADKVYFTDADWNSLLRENIASRRPVIYSGHGVGDHSFILDGYKNDDYYHINFGWGGFADGWYLTDAVNPGSLNLSSRQSALVGIVPDNTGNVILGQTKGKSTFTVDEPLEFYHLLGHNMYEGIYFDNPCNNTITFLPNDNTTQLVADILEFEDQSILFYDGTNTNNELRGLTGGNNNNLSPIVSTTNAITINYTGNMYYAGFKLSISQENGCRMVSNIVSSVDATTVHLSWTENGGATRWQVQYGVNGFELGNGAFVNSNKNIVTINDLEKFTKYDFYIRSVFDDNKFGPWNKVTIMVEAPYWQDIVSSEPEGYTYHPETNSVEISTSEGFAWWAKNECSINAFLTSDIDLSGYKWKPIYTWHDLYGQGHIISNAFINEPTNDVGLFSEFGKDAVIADVGLEDFYVIGRGNRTGGLCGTLRGTAINCFIRNSNIDGGDYTGGLVGDNEYGTIINCYANVYTSGSRWAGLLIGNSHNGNVINCYATGSFRQRAYCYNGGIIAYSDAGVVSNCYSIEMPMGVIGYKGSSIISDTSTFIKNSLECILLTPVSFDNESVSDLLTALNKEVEQQNSNTYCSWEQDSENANGGYPVLGEKYKVLYPNVSAVSIQNIMNGNECLVSVQWKENGEATKWRVRYRRHDIQDATYTYSTVTNDLITIQGIPLGYVYDFNVCAIGDGNAKSGWSETQHIIVDLPYWTDIVNKQPEGYKEDIEGNVEISTVEGLAWLAVKVNGLHGEPFNSFEGKRVVLTSDLNLDGYRWKPIGGFYDKDWHGFAGTFDGQGYSISNLYVNDAYSDLGLFGFVQRGSIKNVNVTNGYVASIFSQTDGETHSTPSSAIGGLIGFASNCYEISNCNSSVNVYGNGGVGSLCGLVQSGPQFEDTYPTTNILNCSSTGSVTGLEACGGLIGDVRGEVSIMNSFATGDINVASGGTSPWYRGGLIGNLMYASVINCFSTGTVSAANSNSDFVAKVIGCPYLNTHVHYIYGQDNVNPELELIGNYCEDIADTTQFHHYDNQNSLLTPVSINDITHTDLLNALNAWVIYQNDQNLKTWILDNNTGYPVFGTYFEPACNNPTDLIVSQATKADDNTIKTRLSWDQIGLTDSWEILYVLSEHNIHEGTIVKVSSNPCVLTDLPLGHPLDFYVRAVCGNDTSNWCKSVTYIPDKLHWTEVVTTQPDGYTEDSEGNVYISSAEGLAWLSSISNGLNGIEYDQNRFVDKRIMLMCDIDLSKYRWTPIGADWKHQLDHAIVEGNNHIISGLYCNELADNQGLFGYLWYGNISNLNIRQCNVYGENYTGGIVGQALHTKIVNCSLTGNVYGVDYVGGIAASHSTYAIENTYFIGTVAARKDITIVNTYGGYVGGICGTNTFDTINNCYVVSEIASDCAYPGIITGTGGSPEQVANCFYKDYETNLSITYSNSNIANNSSFSGSGSSWTLNSPPFVNGSFHSDLVDALNAWVDINNVGGKYRHWIADTANVNGGYPILAPLPDCIVMFKNDDGTVLQTDTLKYGSLPVYCGQTPVKESNSQYSYTFVGWSPNLEPVTKDITYTALFDACMLGDVTGNSSVDIQDATIVVNYILGERSDAYQYSMADLNNDDEIDVFDLTAIINVILGRTNFQAPLRTAHRSTSINGVEDIYLQAVSGKIGLGIDNPGRFTSFQMDIAVPDGAELQNVELTASQNTHFVQKSRIGDNLYRVIALSMSSQPLSDNDNELISIRISDAADADIMVSNVMFVTPKGDAYYFNPATTKIPTVIDIISSDSDDKIYDLSGRRIYRKSTDLDKGVYIINNQKVIIK